MESLLIRCFGLLHATYHGAPLQDLDRSPTLRAFLGYLILHRNQTLSRSRVAGRFWPEAPEGRARRALNNLLWRLRQIADGALAAGMQTTRETIRWTLPTNAWLDLDDFERWTKPIVGGQAETAVLDEETLAALEQATSLYRGALLTDCDAGWCEQPRVRYEERYVQALKTLVLGYEQQQAMARACHYAAKLVHTNPYKEWGHEALVRLCLQSNQPQAALLAYQEYARCWQDELELAPSAQMIPTYGRRKSR